MRRPWIILALLVGGCANLGVDPAALNAPTETGSIAPATNPAEAARGDLRKVQYRAVDEARRPMRAFLAEKGHDCTSPKLKEATHKAMETAGAVAATMKPDYGAMLEAGSAVLDVADGAKGKGCGRDARELYDFVLKNFAGLGYAALRERATVGLRELRAKS